jgi:ABC-2 type transport system ATP-binding protein
VTGMPALAIDVRGLRKSFGSTRALDGLDLAVTAGEVHGFLGPNGSGKSTAMRLLLGLVRAESGTAVLLGQDPWKGAAQIHRRLAYVPGDVSLWPGLTGGEALDVLARLRGGVDPARRTGLIERFELDPTKKGRAYSKGNRQKVALIAALSADVDLLLLDEPTSGLDPLMEATFRQCIDEFRRTGGSVLLSSHILGEVEQLCDRVTLIRAGRTVESGTLDELRHLSRTIVDADLTDPTVRFDPSIVHRLDVVGNHVRFEVDAEHLAAALELLSRAGVRTLVSRPPSLEEVFVKHYGSTSGSPAA